MSITTIRHNRRGITLMEVLISIAVAAIGLLGVAALIPVAAYQAQEGARNDRLGNVGRRSIRETGIRGYYRPGKYNPTTANPKFDTRRWIGGIVPAGFGGDAYAFNAPDDVVFQYTTTDPNEHGKFLRRPYCIDPAFVAYKIANSQPPGQVGLRSAAATANNAFNVTPDVSLRWPDPPPFEFGPPQLRMPRITLTADETLVSAASQVQMLMNVMGLAQAKDCFAFHDDLEFVIPDAKTAAPVQQMFQAGGLTTKRLAKSEFSWFMTLTPSNGDWWTLSTVITRDRNLNQADVYGYFGRWRGAVDDITRLLVVCGQRTQRHTPRLDGPARRENQGGALVVVRTGSGSDRAG